MGNELQDMIDHDRLEEHRHNLIGFKREIELADNKRLDELHMRFLDENEDLSFKETRLVRRVFDFLKAER